MEIDTTLIAALIVAAVYAITRIARSLHTVKQLRRRFLLDMQPEAIEKKLM